MVMSLLEDLPNIGKDTAEKLEAVGIHTADELRAAGSQNAWLAIQAIDPSACYHRLCGLEGAIRGVRWHYLPPEVKKELKDFYNKMK